MEMRTTKNHCWFTLVLSLALLLLVYCGSCYKPASSPTHPPKPESYSNVWAKGKLKKFGDLWKMSTETQRLAIVVGFKFGMIQGTNDFLGITASVSKKYPEIMPELRYYYKNLPVWNFPDVEVLANLMTEFYKDPANVYLGFCQIYEVSIAKLHGASSDSIEKMLAEARKSKVQY